MTNSKNNDRYNSIFATNLRKLMKDNKTTQQELADFIEGTRQSISQYADGSVLPNIEKLEKISNYFNVSCDYLVGKAKAKSTNLDINEIHKQTRLSEDVIKILIEKNTTYYQWINRVFECMEELDNLIISLHNYEELYKVSHYKNDKIKSKLSFGTSKIKNDNKISDVIDYKLTPREDKLIDLTVSNKNATSLMKKITEENFGILLQSMLENEFKKYKEEYENGKHNTHKR